MITGKLIPQQLVFLFVEAKPKAMKQKQCKSSDALVYAGKLEEEKSGDLCWRDLAKFYKNLSDSEIPDLKTTQDKVREGFITYKKGKYVEAEKKFEDASRHFFLLGNIVESKIYDYWTGNCLFYSSQIARNTLVFEKLAEFCEKENYKWLLSYAYSRLGYSAGSINKRSKAVDFAETSICSCQANQ